MYKEVWYINATHQKNLNFINIFVAPLTMTSEQFLFKSKQKQKQKNVAKIIQGDHKKINQLHWEMVILVGNCKHDDTRFSDGNFWKKNILLEEYFCIRIVVKS